MQLKNRIKQEASIDATGKIVFGAAVAGYNAVTLEVDKSDQFWYLLENGSGGYELGGYYQSWDGFTMGYGRWVDQSNVRSGLGFDVSTTGLTLSIVQTAEKSVSSTSGGYGPRTAGVVSMAVGDDAEALLDYSMAVGISAKATYLGEAVFGFGQRPYPSWVNVFAEVTASDTQPLADFAFAAGQLYGKGVLRITGSVLLTNSVTESATETQVVDVSLLLTDIGGTAAVLGTPAFTNLVSGSGLSGITLSYSGGTINIANAGSDDVVAVGLLYLQWLSLDDWWG